jgi:hypothetical protein
MVLNATYIMVVSYIGGGNRRNRRKTEKTFKNTEEAIKNGQSREIGNIGYTKHKTKTIKTKTTMHYVLDTTIHKHTTNVNKT